MNMVDTQSIRLSRIDIGERLRAVDDDYVVLIASSMADVGQMTPVEVRPLKRGEFELVAGAHRMAAALLLGWDDITAVVRDLSDLEAELRQIDENLARHELSPFDRATFLARRQEVYLGLHPDTAQGKAGASGRWMQRTTLSFASEAAVRVGVSERDIRRSIARFKNIAPDVRKKIAGTWIAESGAQLDALAREEASNQRKALPLMLRLENPVKSVKLALKMLSGATDAPKDLDAEHLGKLQDAWRRSGPHVHGLFLDWLSIRSRADADLLARASARQRTKEAA